ncbi:hypothetical protein LshimejAT787_0310860 [Lyophyllum shimeji]|uniref:Uncharacterized protein n=1 Tax=Lyophyllum shimeji TaxID=47721 RepID=A0A9P3PJW0_LYOSH|nr:hypothetical protein LshimejAT787_0310860 [Lyophyllum shimeji]
MYILDRRKLRQKSPDLASLLGTYHWVCNGHPEAEEGDITPDSDSGDMDWGGITLSLRPGTDTSVAKPADVVGSFKQGMIGGTFEGLVRSRGGWEIKRVVWEGDDVEDVPEEGQGLWLTKVLDDDGSPFLGMFVEEGQGDVDAQYNMLAKKQKEGYGWGKGMKWEGLTEAEKQRVKLADDGEEEEERDDDEEEEENGADDDDNEQDDEEEEADSQSELSEEGSEQPVREGDEQKGATSKRKAESEQDSETGKKARRD